jgi:hypothetical protein
MLKYFEIKDASDLFIKYKFDVTELNIVRIDITFTKDEITNFPRQNNSSIIDFTKNALIHHPEIRPLLYILKRYLNNKKLNTCFTGKILII